MITYVELYTTILCVCRVSVNARSAWLFFQSLSLSSFVCVIDQTWSSLLAVKTVVLLLIDEMDVVQANLIDDCAVCSCMLSISLLL